MFAFILLPLFVVGRTGFEPVKAFASDFTDRPVWPLRYRPLHITWSRRRESNPEPTVYKTVALPIELRRQWLTGRASRLTSALVFYHSLPLSANRTAVLFSEAQSSAQWLSSAIVGYFWAGRLAHDLHRFFATIIVSV